MSQNTTYRWVERVMGTAVVFDLRDPLDPEAVRRAVADLHWVDATFSTYRIDSEISRLGRNELAFGRASLEVRTVLEECDRISERTNRSFDVHSRLHGSPRLDPSGYVKGWAVERAASLLRQAGADNFTINAGGDVAAKGCPVMGRPWQVGVRHPAHPGRLAAIVAATNTAVATSGTYERGEHIWGRRDASLASVTVTGPDLGYADAYATALFAAGVRGLEWFGALSDYEAFLITDTGDSLATPGFPFDQARAA